MVDAFHRVSRWGDTFMIELSCDLSRRPGGRVGSEYPTNDLRFSLDDLQFPDATGDGPVPVRPATRMSSVTYDAGHPTANLFCPVLALHLPDQPPNADQDCIGNAVVNGAYLDAKKGQPLMDARQVLHVTRETVERFHKHHVECAFARSIHKPHQTVTAKNGGARSGSVFIDTNDIQALPSCLGPAKCNLIFRRPFVLEFSRKSCVNDRARHRSMLPLAASARHRQYHAGKSDRSRRHDRALRLRSQVIR
jgi:hypothetical protein